MRKMKKLVLSVALALMLMLAWTVPTLAADFDEITVTATPSFLSISIAQDTWTINGIDGTGKILIATTYYSNATGASGDVTAPSANVTNGDCYFEIANASNVATNMTANMVHFTGGDAMQNIDTGYANNGANAFGASTYTTGAAWPAGAVILKNSGSAALKSSVAPTTNVFFGIAIKTQSGAWTTGSAQTSTVTVTATAS